MSTAPANSTTVASNRKSVRDSVLVTLGGQIERAVGTITALSLRWGLRPEVLGVYTGLRLYLDNTNRSSLGIGLGAVQEIPILRAAGRDQEANHLANVTYTTNTITCACFSLSILALAAWRSLNVAPGMLHREWVWGLVAVAFLALIKRHETFLIAMLRAHGQFALTAELDVLESSVSAVLVPLGLWLAGLWGLLFAVGLLLLVKIAYVQRRHRLRFQWSWDPPLAWKLMRVGLPILANTAAFGFLISLDRMLILWRMPDAERAAGLYTIAIMGTSWSLDLAGRIVLVLYNTFQTTLGRTNEPAAVIRQAIRANEAQAPLLLAGASIAYLAGPTFLGLLMPRYFEGVEAIRPLLPGSVMLALAWPARQVLITLSRPFRLFLATTLGFFVAAGSGIIGVDRFGIVGLAWGMSLGYAATFLITTAAAIIPELGLRAWTRHLGRLLLYILGFSAAVVSTTHIELNLRDELRSTIIRLIIMFAWLIPVMIVWGESRGWGGLLPGFSLKGRLARRAWTVRSISH